MKGLVHIYCGDGKGKSTALMGLCLRALGAGKKVVVAQFLKGGTSSELEPLRHLGAEIIPCPPVKKFVFQMDDTEKALLSQETVAMFNDAISRSCDLLALDELCGAVSTGILPEELVLEFLRSKPAQLEVVMSGRGPTPQLSAQADYISEICKIKHPFDQGIPARKGIEF